MFIRHPSEDIKYGVRYTSLKYREKSRLGTKIGELKTIIYFLKKLYTLYSQALPQKIRLVMQRGLRNSMKLWAMPCRATQDRQVTWKGSGKIWSTGGGNGKPLQYSCRENPMNSMKKQKIWHQKMSPQVGRHPTCYWEEQRAITNSSRKNEEAGPKQKRHSVVDMSGGESLALEYKMK